MRQQPQVTVATQPCCPRDTDRDGNCDIHIRPGVLRLNLDPKGPYKQTPTGGVVPNPKHVVPPCLSCLDECRPVFVFGSNLAGRHGAGAALHAVQAHGAKYGQGIGRQGNSYAIPTLGYNLERISLNEVAKYVEQFIVYAEDHQGTKFFLTAIGTGLAGIPVEDMKEMVVDCPLNVIRPEGW